jgi:hypothetical protein
MINQSQQKLYSEKRLRRPDSSTKLLYFDERRDFFLQPYYGKGIQNGRKENAIANIVLKQQGQEMAVINGYGGLLRAVNNLCLSEGQRQKIVGSMNIVVEIPNEASSAEHHQRYKDSIGYTTGGTVALTHDETGRDKRNEAAANLLAQFYSQTIESSAYLTLSKNWLGDMEFNFYEQLQQVLGWIDSMQGTPEDLRKAFDKMELEITTAHTLDAYTKNLALLVKLQTLEMKHLAKPVLVAMPTDRKDDDGDTIMEDVMMNKPLNSSFPPHLDGYFAKLLLRKTGLEKPLSKIRDKIEFAISKDWTMDKISTKTIDLIASTTLPDPDKPTPVIRAAVATTHHEGEAA